MRFSLYIATGVCIAVVGLCLPATAQNNPLSGKDSLVLENERIQDVIESEKPPMRPPAQQYQRPGSEQVDFNARQYYIDTDYQPDNLMPKPVDPSVADDVYNGMIRLGLGRYMTPLFEAYYDNRTGVEDVGLGFEFLHHSAHQDDIRFREFRRNYGTITGSLLTSDAKLYGKLHLYNTRYFNYADTLPRATEGQLEEDILMRFTRFETSAGITSLQDSDSPLAYDIQTRVRYYDGIRDNLEFNFSLLPTGSYALTEEFSIQADAEWTFTRGRLAGDAHSRNFLGFSPTIHFQNDLLEVKGGFRFNNFSSGQQQITEGSTLLAPVAEVKFGLIPEELIIVAGIDGGIRNNLYYDMIMENPYLRNDIVIQATQEKLNVYGGVQGNITQQFDYSGRVYYKRVENPLIYTIPSDGAYFNVAYDSLMEVFGAHFEANYDLDNDLRIGGALTVNNYTLTNQEKYFHATPIRLDAYATYILDDQFTLQGRMNFYGSTPVTVDSSGDILRRNAFVNVGFSADYRIVERFSIYLRLNNLLGTEFQRWFNYPERPIDFSGGITFIF
ncbi:MAG: TonB-dependent receptor [Bacteroidota bacterium]